MNKRIYYSCFVFLWCVGWYNSISAQEVEKTQKQVQDYEIQLIDDQYFCHVGFGREQTTINLDTSEGKQVITLENSDFDNHLSITGGCYYSKWSLLTSISETLSDINTVTYEANNYNRISISHITFGINYTYILVMHHWHLQVGLGYQNDRYEYISDLNSQKSDLKIKTSFYTELRSNYFFNPYLFWGLYIQKSLSSDSLVNRLVGTNLNLLVKF